MYRHICCNLVTVYCENIILTFTKSQNCSINFIPIIQFVMSLLKEKKINPSYYNVCLEKAAKEYFYKNNFTKMLQ